MEEGACLINIPRKNSSSSTWAYITGAMKAQRSAARHFSAGLGARTCTYRSQERAA